MRISRQQMFMAMSRVAAQRSTCRRLNVGAVVVSMGRVPRLIGIGYNGSPPGEPHCSGSLCPVDVPCRRAIHAEINALHHAQDETESDWHLYVTHSPCRYCWKFICEGYPWISRVYFEHEYRATDHLRQSPRRPPQLLQIQPAGHVMDWHTREVISDGLES